jgi:hypothetical protein
VPPITTELHAGVCVINFLEVTTEVVGLWRYPVKSLQGEPVDSARLEADGVLGDRRWGIHDRRTGRILTARRRPELLHASASYDGDEPVVRLPDGQTLAGKGKRTDDQLSEWLSGPVSLVTSLGNDPGTAEYFQDATDDNSQAIEWTMPAGRYVDAAPVLLLTTSSLRTGATLHPDGAWDTRRFRPNILVDLHEEGWVEDSWVGGQVHVGAITLKPTQPCIRCTMVTRSRPGLVADLEVFRTLARHHSNHFGVWSEVLTPGAVSLGTRCPWESRRPETVDSPRVAFLGMPPDGPSPSDSRGRRRRIGLATDASRRVGQGLPRSSATVVSTVRHPSGGHCGKVRMLQHRRVGRVLAGPPSEHPGGLPGRAGPPDPVDIRQIGQVRVERRQPLERAAVRAGQQRPGLLVTEPATTTEPGHRR